jgi:protein O-mannosyl-transferase
MGKKNRPKIDTRQKAENWQGNGSTQKMNGSHIWMPAVCIALALIAYLPVFRADFVVNGDDADYVLKNLSITSFENIKEILIKPVQGNYHPLTMLTLAANYAISGTDAGSYHALNLLLHLLNVLLVFFFVKRVAGDKHWLAFFVALMFAVHPLHVESVAWVSERKDVLYSFFFLIGLLVYLRYLRIRGGVNYLATLAAFTFSLLSKPAACVFPLVLLAIDFYRGRLRFQKTWFEKIPFFALSVFIGVLTLHAQDKQGAVWVATTFPVYYRFFFGSYGIMMYLVKAVWPIGLAAFYIMPMFNQPLPFIYYLSPLMSVALAVVFLITYKRNRLIAFAVLFYLINLLLILQFLPVGGAIIADRYAYMPLLGVFLIPGIFFQQWIDKKPRGPLPELLLIAVIIMLSTLTYSQAATWKNDISLWDHAIRVAPSSRAYSERGSLYKIEKQDDKAMEMFNHALRINKLEAQAWINRGNIFYSRSQWERAIDDYTACLSIYSSNALAIENRGNAYFGLGKYDLALADMDRAISINSRSETAYMSRGLIYQKLGRHREAILDFTKQMVINCAESAAALGSMAASYINLKEYEKALELLTRAISMNEDGRCYFNRAIAYVYIGRKSEALQDALRARSLGFAVDPSFINSLK